MAAIVAPTVAVCKLTVGCGAAPTLWAAEVALVADTTFGWLYFCQASQSMTREKEKTSSRRRRRLSMNGLCEKFQGGVSGKFQGTGSKPPEFQGWQREMRFRPRPVPLKAPYFCTASAVYSEQLGKKRQRRPKKGLIAYW